MDTTGELVDGIPQNILKVAESGIHTSEDVSYLKILGVDAMLIGEAIVTATDPGDKVAIFAKAGRLNGD
jgi:indole-3-glycerol phosphate synthase